MQSILDRLRPTKKEERGVKRLANQIIKKLDIKGSRAELGGSGAKGTWLRGTSEIDVYVKFNPEIYGNKDISEILKKKLKKRFKNVVTLHGSRDYYQIRYQNLLFEIVPILDIKDVRDAQNITDVSPFHAKWVRRHNLGDEIRLAKAFCRAQGCYGAESYIRGFSGYALEVLTIYYGSFDSLVRHAALWRSREFIDIEKHATRLNKAKRMSPLILIDPVQPDRNVTASLSKEKYKLFVQAARKYLENPSEDSFVEKVFSPDDIKKRFTGYSLVLFRLTPKQGKRDVTGAKLLKVYEYAKRLFEEEEFNVVASGWHWDRHAYMWYAFEKGVLSGFRKHLGPRIEQKKHLQRFREKNRKCKLIIESGRLVALVPRRYSNPQELAKSLLNNSCIRQKVSAIRLV